jgi:hypothetical protein
MGSKFLREIAEHQAYLERLQRDGTDNPRLLYVIMQGSGTLKPFTVRIPSPYLAVLEEVLKHGPWQSKQEMVFRMIESAYLEYREQASPELQKRLDEVMDKEIEAFNKKQKAKRVELMPRGTGTKKKRKQRSEK